MPFEVKSQEDIINDILLNILTNVPTLSDANIGSVFRQNVEALGIEIRRLYESLQTIYDGTRITTATGSDLEELGLLVGQTRGQGSTSTGTITMRRNSPALSNFTIATSNIVSTQPNTGASQLKFQVSATTTFLSSITAESHNYIDGNYDYALEERFVSNTTGVSISGYATSTSNIYSFVNGVDFIIPTFNDFVVDVDTIDLVDDCDDTTGWSESADADAVTTSPIHKQGDYSLNLGKSGVASDEAFYSKTLGTEFDGTNKWFVFYVYVEDTSIRNLISQIVVNIGSGGSVSDSYKFTIPRSAISSTSQWNRFRFRYNDTTTTIVGNPVISAINFIRFNIITETITDTFSLGAVKMDYFIFAETRSYEGNIVQWLETTSPISGTAFEVDYIPLSKEVPIRAVAVGSDYNVNKGKIGYKVTDIPNINSVYNYDATEGGVDVESDDNFRTRIQAAAQGTGKATIAAIKAAALAVAGVVSIEAEDMPLLTTTSEQHTFFSGQSVYALSREVIYHNAEPPTNIEVTGTAGGTSYTFLYGTDFISISNSDGVRLSKIQFQTTGTSPDVSTAFNVEYDYNWLGHVYLYVASSAGTPTAELMLEVSSVVEETKAAGVTVHYIAPTTVFVSVTAEIEPKENYTFSQIQTDIEDAIYNYINTRGIGEDVYVAGLYDVIMEVEGVENAHITLPAADVTIDVDEIAKPGTITLSEM